MSPRSAKIPDVLDDLARRTLDFEAQYVTTSRAINGAKEVRIRETFDESATRYYARLNALLANPDAEAAYPALVHRLKRMREARRAARSGW